MALLDKIKQQVTLPPPPQPATPPPITDMIIDIEVRDQFISACLAVPHDATAQHRLWEHYRDNVTNMATLKAAVKLISKSTDKQLERFAGHSPLWTGAEVMIKTGKEWSEQSQHGKI